MHLNLVGTVLWLAEHKDAILAAVVGVIAGASVVVKALEVLVAILVSLFPSLKTADGELTKAAAFLDALAKSRTLNALALSPKSAKALLLAVALGLFLQPAPARASGLDWSTGPSLPFLEYDFGNPHPVSIVPGAGMQLSVTHDALKRAFMGKSWDIVDLNLAAFGSVVSSSSGQQFGALSVSAGVCTMSSLVCLGVGKHVLSADQSFARGGWFLSLGISFNFALAPEAPPVGIASGAAGMVRGNTLYLGGM